MSNQNLTLAQAIAKAVEMGGGYIYEGDEFIGDVLSNCSIRWHEEHGWVMPIYHVRPIPPRTLSFEEALPHLLEGNVVKGMEHTCYALRLVRTDKEGKTFFGSVDMRTAKDRRFIAPEDTK